MAQPVQLISFQDYSTSQKRCISLLDTENKKFTTHTVEFKIDGMGKLFALVSARISVSWKSPMVIHEDHIFYESDKKRIIHEKGIPLTAESLTVNKMRQKIIDRIRNRDLLVADLAVDSHPDHSYIVISPEL